MILLNIVNRSIFHKFYLEILFLHLLYCNNSHIMEILVSKMVILNTLGIFFDYKNCSKPLIYRSNSTLYCTNAKDAHIIYTFSYLDYSFFINFPIKCTNTLFLSNSYPPFLKSSELDHLLSLSRKLEKNLILIKKLFYN